MAKKPQIRFQGHHEEWEESLLKKAVDYNTTGVRACDISPNGKYDLYDANEVIGKVNTYASDKPYLSIIKDGSGVGRVRLLPELTNVLGTMGVISPKGGNNINFIFSHIQKKDFKQHIISGAIPHVYFKNYGEDKILIPLPEEQQKIGDFFSTLDELISAKEEELQKLRQLKQALLQQMFPANNEDNLAGEGNSQVINLLQGSNLTISTAPNTPRIRFKGFTEPWQKKTFGDYGYISMCKRVMKYQTSVKGEIPFFKIGTFGGEPDAYISRELFTQLKNNYQYPEEGDILISAAGTLGRAVVFNGKDQYFQDSNIVWLNHKGKIYNPFLKLLYGVVKWNSVEGSTLKRLYNSNILNSEIYVPEYKEQQMIGDFFREQDEQINAAQQQIKKLTIIKQALLQKMFAA